MHHTKKYKKFNKLEADRRRQQAAKQLLINLEKEYKPPQEQIDYITGLLKKAFRINKTTIRGKQIRLPYDLSHIAERIAQNAHRLNISEQQIIQDLMALWTSYKSHPDLHPHKNYSIIAKTGKSRLVASIYIGRNVLCTTFYYIDEDDL